MLKMYRQVPDFFLILVNRPNLADAFIKHFRKNDILKEDYQKTLKNLTLKEKCNSYFCVTPKNYRLMFVS